MSLASEITTSTPSFDYGSLPDVAASELRKIANKIGRLKRKMTSDAIAIGGELAKAKSQIAHGHFEAWCERECSFSLRVAEAYMSLARSQHRAKLQELPLTIASLLAAPSTPPAVVDEVVSESVQGRRPKTAEVKSRIRAARGGGRSSAAIGAGTKRDKDADDIAKILVGKLEKNQLQRLMDLLASPDAARKLRSALERRLSTAAEKAEPTAANA